MNCQHFEELMVDLVRENGLEDSVRSQALEHAERCLRCSSRLASQQALSAAFKLAGAEGGEAPAHMEAALLAAYRERQAQTPREVPANRIAGFIPYGYWGIAAALLVALAGVATFRAFQTPPPTRVAGTAQTVPAKSTSQPARAELSPAPADVKDKPTTAVVRLEPLVKKATPRKPAAKPQPAEDEIATDFFPLASTTEIAAMESGQIVRVLMPRNVMASYGLPVNQERADEPVAAQVLIGQDGVARAIRFLSGQSTNYVQTGIRAKR